MKNIYDGVFGANFNIKNRELKQKPETSNFLESKKVSNKMTRWKISLTSFCFKIGMFNFFD